MSSERTDALYLITDQNPMGYTFFARAKDVEDGVHIDAFSPSEGHALQWTDTIPRERVDESMKRNGISNPHLAAALADYDTDYLQENLSVSRMGLSMLKDFPQADIPREYQWNNDQLPKDDIRFITSRYETLFYLPNGGLISVDFPDRPASVKQCEYLDDYHTSVNGECYHICQWAEIMEQNQSTCQPEQESLSDTEQGAWKLGWRNYITVEKAESGWDYALYDRNFGNYSTGHLSDSSLTLLQAREKALDSNSLHHRNREPVDFDMVMEKSAEAAEVARVEQKTSVLETLNSTKSLLEPAATKSKREREPER